MTSMYQEIDEIDQDELVEPRVPRWVWPAAALVILCVGAFFFLGPNDSPTPNNINDARKAELASYRAAITEPSAAMRRARLTDFLTTYPQSDHTESAEALLRVLAAGEAEDWAALTEQIFNPDLSREEKLAALSIYETSWGASLLGGRGEEISALREELSAEIKKFPSRKMKEDKTSVPDSIDDTQMVGGLQPAKPISPVITPVIDDVVELDTKRPKIVPPKLRKPSHPKYPRKAYRAGISALVTVSLDIDEKGKVKRVRVIEVDADRYKDDFAKASTRAAKKSRYYPKTVKGRPVATGGHVKRYRFTPN